VVVTVDEGKGNYRIHDAHWDLIGKESVAVNPTIPAMFCHPISNIAKEWYLFTAEVWAFWTVYLAPYLLEGHLPAKYYQHSILLVDIIKILLKLVITDADIDWVEQHIIFWVWQYEEWVLLKLYHHDY
jgi:hypothetical protein